MSTFLRPATVRQKQYARAYVQTNDRQYAAEVAGYAGPPLMTAKLAELIRAESMAELAELRPAAMGVLRRALDPEQDMRHQLAGLREWGNMVKIFGTDGSEEASSDPSEMSGEALARLIADLVAEERQIIDGEASTDVIDDAETITEVDPFD